MIDMITLANKIDIWCKQDPANHQYSGFFRALQERDPTLHLGTFAKRLITGKHSDCGHATVCSNLPVD